MSHDAQRLEWNTAAIGRSGFTSLICGLPSNVLLLSQGYWPVVGCSLALATADGRVALIVPEDERELAEESGDGEVHTFKAASLDDLHVAEDVIWRTLANAAKSLGVAGGTIGCEIGASYEPVTYPAMHRFKMSLERIVRLALPGCTIANADEMLATLLSICTPLEIQHVKRSCRAAWQAFKAVKHHLRPGVSEIVAAAQARLPLHLDAQGRDQQHFAIMSGIRSAQASGAFATSSDKELAAGELALVHCNSNIAGYWTDITRTFCLGPPSPEQVKMYEAVAAARTAAISLIRPGTRAADVDHAARQVLTDRGYGDAFKHSTGHGVGFAAIDHNALPRLHPHSPDILQTGMVFNVEPAIYIKNQQGMRHCDMVAVTESSAEVLTPFLSQPQDLIVHF